MTDAKRWTWRRLFIREFFTPRGFAVTAVEITVIFLVLHLLGARHHTSILIGAAERGAAPGLARGLALTYMLFYFAFIGLVPIFTLAAAFFQGAVLLRRRRVEAQMDPPVDGSATQAS